MSFLTRERNIIPKGPKYRFLSKIVSEYDQEIPLSQTADNPWHHKEDPLNHHETPGRQISKATSSLFPIKMIAILEWT